jgi:uncharacterized Zn finger protein (UPF0148 family)
MSLWVCPEHGLYGGDVFCPKCGKNGEFATLHDALSKDTSMVDDPFAEMAKSQSEHKSLPGGLSR